MTDIRADCWQSFVREVDSGKEAIDDGLWGNLVSATVTLAGLAIFGVLTAFDQSANESRPREALAARLERPSAFREQIGITWPTTLEDLIAGSGERIPVGCISRYGKVVLISPSAIALNWIRINASSASPNACRKSPSKRD